MNLHRLKFSAKSRRSTADWELLDNCVVVWRPKLTLLLWKPKHSDELTQEKMSMNTAGTTIAMISKENKVSIRAAQLIVLGCSSYLSFFPLVAWFIAVVVAYEIESSEEHLSSQSPHVSGVVPLDGIPNGDKITQ
jgi:hypothetical protein